MLIALFCTFPMWHTYWNTKQLLYPSSSRTQKNIQYHPRPHLFAVLSITNYSLSILDFLILICDIHYVVTLSCHNSHGR
jgi:hypothetical protein